MAVVELKIVDVLRLSGRPMKALDIARSIGEGYGKKDVNRVIHKMKEVEIANPGENPPLWRLIGSASTTPSEGATVANRVAGVPLDTAAAVTPGTKREGSEASLSSRLAKVCIGDDASATLNNKLLTTIERTEEGGILISPISRDYIINQATGVRTNEEQSESRPVQESASLDVKENADSLSKKVDPINLFSGHKQLLEKDTIEDNPPSKQKDDAASKTLDCALQSAGGGRVNDLGASSDQPSSTLTSKTKKRPMIAANFGGVVAAETSDSLKKKVMDILRKEGSKLSARDVSKLLGHQDRLLARGALEELKREGKVYAVVNDGISYWSIRIQE